MDSMENSLKNMNQAVWYNQWTFKKISKYLKGDILEVGCGIGNFTKSLTEYGKVWTIDIDQSLIKKTKKRLNKKAQAGYGDIEKGKYFFKKKHFDTIVCFNVLEHIKNDKAAIKNLNQLLKKGGMLLLIVPAHPLIFGNIDKHVGHFRRYEKNKLFELLKSNNFDVIVNKRINSLGAVGWWFSGKVLKNTSVNLDKLSVFNKIAPFLLPIEDITGTPVGISLLTVSQKNIMKNNSKQLNGVSLIIPVLNEEKTLNNIISKCSSQKIVKQLVIVNDGSTDNTKRILNQIADKGKNSKNPLTTIIHHPKNMGKGAAIKTGLKYTLGKYVMVQDADLEYSPTDIKSLFDKAEKLKFKIVFGTRSQHKKKAYILARLGNWYLSLMYNILFNLNLTDGYTCYKLIPRSIWIKMDLKCDGFEIDSELISKLGMNKYRIKEMPISYSPRKYSEGKKIKWIDLFKASWVAFKVRLFNNA